MYLILFFECICSYLDNSRCHGGAHVVLVGDGVVGDDAGTGGADIGHVGVRDDRRAVRVVTDVRGIGQAAVVLAVGFDNARAGAGDRPLGGRRALGAVLERKSVLAFGGAIVGRGGGDRPDRGTALDGDRRHHQPERHGRACAVHARVRDTEAAHGKARGDALI